MQKRSKSDYQPFIVGGDGEVTIHGSGPGDADEAVARAARQFDRPKVTRHEHGDYVGVELNGGDGMHNDPDACPHCHMVHQDQADVPDSLKDVDCRELIASAREFMPNQDPDGDFCTLTICVTCAAGVEDVRGAVDQIMAAVPEPLGATIGMEELPFLGAVAAIAKQVAVAELAGAVGDMVDEAEATEQVKRDARNN